MEKELAIIKRFHHFSFKLSFTLLLLLAVFFETSRQQNPNCRVSNTTQIHCTDEQPLATPKPVIFPADAAGVKELMDRLPEQKSHERNLSYCDNLDDYLKCNCDFQNHTLCRVTELDFSDRKIDGSIPAKIGDLIYLEEMDLSNNMLTGTIPRSVANLSNLQTLYLSGNRLTGPVPPIIYGIKSLTTLYLNENLLRGRIPSELGNLDNLQYLDISVNELVGTVPPSLGKWNLAGLNVGGNRLSGKFPDVVFSWKKLQYFLMMGNNFEAPSSTFGATNSSSISTL